MPRVLPNSPYRRKKEKKRLKIWLIQKNVVPLHPLYGKIKVDPLAQSVEHNTFNVGVLGSSPKRITGNERLESLSFFVTYLKTINEFTCIKQITNK